MRLNEAVALVGSGASGFGLTDRWDAHAYLLDGGDEAALVDAGLGRGADAILERVRSAGVALDRLRTVLVTHGHPDHCGGVAALRERIPHLQVVASALVARWMRSGDQESLSVAQGRRAEFYPPDFSFTACPVEGEAGDGDRLQVGRLDIEVVETPGHADGHLAFLVRAGTTRLLCSGDLVFYGGSVSLLNTWDCRIQAYADSMARLRDARVDALLPGHHGVSLAGGQGHVDAANRRFDAGLVPPSIV